MIFDVFSVCGPIPQEVVEFLVENLNNAVAWSCLPTLVREAVATKERTDPWLPKKSSKSFICGCLILKHMKHFFTDDARARYGAGAFSGL
ncbi:unnamed protein product [Soboliphyme baturini]|uniref:Uncharacterized protein n=1 Tax=Soboliphyme baturini TaxID=241478 RepID=A0A183IY25_9BILA|nr:unnamed protein product [Soboliphyme baturini]